MSDLGEKAGNSYCISLYFWWNSRWCDLPDHKSRKKNSTRNVVKINTYSATAAATAEPQETPATGGSNNSSRLTTENMNRMSEQLAAIGGQASASIVGVKNKTDAQDWFSEKQNNSKNVSFGIIYKENTKNYYIATTYNIVKEQHTVSVQLADETVVEGKVLDSDLQYNVAVITISKSKITQETQEKMHVAELDMAEVCAMEVM